MTQKKTNTVFHAGDKVVDLSKAWPLTMGDFEDLEEAGLITADGELEWKGFRDINKLVFHLANKANNKVTKDDIRSIPAESLQEIMGAISSILTEDKKPNRPT